MSWLKKAVKGGIAVKAMQMIKRQAAKPENQRRAREAFEKLQQRRRRPH